MLEAVVLGFAALLVVVVLAAVLIGCVGAAVGAKSPAVRILGGVLFFAAMWGVLSWVFWIKAERAETRPTCKGDR